MSKHDIGPRAPWYDLDEPEYMSTYQAVFDSVVELLLLDLRERADRIKSAQTAQELIEEMRDCMTLAASHSKFGEVREWHDQILELLIAEDEAKRVV